MSTSVYWLPAKPKAPGNRINYHYEPSVKEWLDAGPVTLGMDDLPYLEGRRDSLGNDDNAWADLIEAIEKHGEIEVWVQ